MHAGAQPSAYGRTDLDYNDYLKVPELLELQKPLSVPAHHDEMLFIVIHQAYELWFKLVLHEGDTAIEYMKQAQVLRAHHFIKRIVEIMKLGVQQIHLLETMTPVEFLEFRDRIMPASGFQSVQFREIEFLAGLKEKRYVDVFVSRPELAERLKSRLNGPDLRSAYYELLRKLGFNMPLGASEKEREEETSDERQTLKQVISAIRPIYQRPADHLPLYLLSESLIEFDEYLALWRDHHVRVVERVIGHKRGSGGSAGVDYLRTTTAKKCFPALWEVRTHLEKVN
ncbi:MAG TPA: tryptophan 2,3-dioxygenase family protein [Bdellovibrionota bacterium]|nr:tryptophan 2,3-dioxygenase family protein [Bdellovibrionota bacterium]